MSKFKLNRAIMVKALKTTIQEKAIVLRSQPYSENDLILSLLTKENGKISAILKKVRGKAAYQPEILDLAQFELKSSSNSSTLYYIRTAKPEKSFIGLRNRLMSFSCACAWIESVDLLTLESHQEASELYNLCAECLTALDGEQDNRQNLRILFESLHQALHIIGYANPESETATLNNLKAIAHKIENISHRKLRSFDNVYSLVQKEFS